MNDLIAIQKIAGWEKFKTRVPAFSAASLRDRAREVRENARHSNRELAVTLRQAQTLLSARRHDDKTVAIFAQFGIGATRLV
jgi:hypothetical protein